jgi:hypothetical protein
MPQAENTPQPISSDSALEHARELPVASVGGSALQPGDLPAAAIDRAPGHESLL